MKKRIKDITIGILIGCIIMATPVLADDIVQQINVIFDGVEVQINGEKLDSHTILYNGTTYLPMRKIAEAVGKEIEWNPDTKTANIVNKVVEVKDNIGTSITNDSTTISNDFITFSKEYKNIYIKLNQDGLYNMDHMDINSIAKIGGKYYLSWSNVFSLINIAEGDYKIEKINNPYLLGRLIVENPSYDVKTEQQFSNINTGYYVGSIYKKSDENKSYYFTTKEDSNEGLYMFKNGTIWISIDDILSFFGYKDKCKIEFDDINKFITVNIIN